MQEAEEVDAFQVAGTILESLELLTLRDTGEVLFYDERAGVYRFNGEAEVAAKCQLLLEEKCSKHVVEEVLGHIRRSTYCDRKDFDARPEVLNTANGLLDVSTMGFNPHVPAFLSLQQIPHKFDPLAECPNIEAFLGSTLYPEDVKVLQEVVGYCLWRGYPAAKLFVFVGDGENGKSTTLNLLKALLGSDNLSARTIQSLEKNRFASASLFGKLANICADVPSEGLETTGMLKMLTGGDLVPAERKLRDLFEFVNYAKLLFSANVPPEVHDDTTAFYRRLVVFAFPYTFVEGADEKLLGPDADKIRKADKDVLTKITTPEEMSGFLNWALKGLKRLKEHGWTFSYSRGTQEVKDDYIRKSSPVKAFVLDRLEEKAEEYILRDVIYPAFLTYCEEMRLPTKSRDAFFKKLPEYLPKATRYRPTLPDGSRPWALLGVRLKKRQENDKLG